MRTAEVALTPLHDNRKLMGELTACRKSRTRAKKAMWGDAVSDLTIFFTFGMKWSTRMKLIRSKRKKGTCHAIVEDKLAG